MFKYCGMSLPSNFFWTICATSYRVAASSFLKLFEPGFYLSFIANGLWYIISLFLHHIILLNIVALKAMGIFVFDAMAQFFGSGIRSVFQVVRDLLRPLFLRIIHTL